jgi:TonB-linked SusC/RagA family outer membrane protein
MLPNRRMTTLLAAPLAVLFFWALPGELSARQATGTVQGRAIDGSTNRPLAGVQISVTGTQRGTITGADGTYRITGVPAGEREVRAQHIGYQSMVRPVRLGAGETATADFDLHQSVLDLEEIVVTGVAGQTTRAKLPFTVERLTQAAMPVPGVDAASMIQGKVAGAMVTNPTGRPGTAPSILLRGPTSIRANERNQEPLYIVDGVILASSISDIDSNDIESIEIVKGAAAASLYGSRAANGVIQITTNRGQNVGNDQVRYTLRTEYGSSDLPGRFNLTQRHQFLQTSDGRFVDSGGNPCEWIRCAGVSLAGQMALPGESRNEWNTIQRESWPGQTYDHVERFFRGGEFMTNQVSVSGRSGGTNYLVSYNRQDNEGIMPFRKGDLRHQFRVNVDQSVRTDLTVSATAMYSRSRRSDDDGAMFALTRMPAGVDLLSDDPNIDGVIVIKPDPFNDNINPIYTMSTQDILMERGRYLGSVNARWSPLSWFELDGNFSIDRLDANREVFRPKGFRNIQGIEQGGNLTHRIDRTEGLNGSLTANFRRRFGDLGTTTQVRYLMEREDFNRTETEGSEFTAFGVWSFDNIPDANESAESRFEPIRRDGFFVITGLDYKDRYIVDALARQDGSSLFGPDERRHWYYRGSAAYRLAEEPWFNIRGLDELKLRYSIGSAGREPNFTAQYETYSVEGGSITPVTLGNRDLKPEFAVEHEMGIEALFLGRFSLDLTYARADIKDQILSVPSLAYTGFSSQIRNAGRLESNTYEATLNAQVFRGRNFTWNTRLLFDRTRHKITELDVPAYQDGPSTEQGLGNVFYIRKGETLGTFYGFQFAEQCGHLPEGVDCSQFQVNDDGYLVWVGGAGSWQNGWNTYTDENGETRHWWGTTSPITIRGQAIRWGEPFQAEAFDPISGERATFLPLGNTTPKYRLGFANTFTWRGFVVYGLFESVQGFYVYNQPLQWATFQSYSGIMDQSGQPEALQKPTGYYSRLYGASGLQPSSAFVHDGSFVKLRELSLRYRPSAEFLSRLPLARGLDGMTLSITGRNLITWSDYDGYDPDVGESGGNIGSASLGRVDGYNYPPFRTLTLGVELNF